jgi:energy-coupling factor transporter ATP-binding protein EcfA2
VANPFASRHVRPGRLRPLTADAQEHDVRALVATIDEAGGSAAIVGPHGSGKSTLLAALAAELQAEGRLVGILQVRSLRDLPAAVRMVATAGSGSTACLDGWERLGRLGSRVVRTIAWVRGCHLMATSHRPVGLAVTLSTSTSPQLLAAVVAALPEHGGLIIDSDLREAFARHGGNLRESLSDLYDRFEERARRPLRS